GSQVCLYAQRVDRHTVAYEPFKESENRPPFRASISRGVVQTEFIDGEARMRVRFGCCVERDLDIGRADQLQPRGVPQAVVAAIFHLHRLVHDIPRVDLSREMLAYTRDMI